MMHYFNLEYHELGLALSMLGTRDFKQLFQTVHRYCIASANDPDAPIPTSDNEKINGFLFGMCTRIQAGAVAHERKSKVNRDNAKKRWSKSSDHGGDGDDDDRDDDHQRGDHRGGRGNGDHGGGDGGQDDDKGGDRDNDHRGDYGDVDAHGDVKQETTTSHNSPISRDEFLKMVGDVAKFRNKECNEQVMEAAEQLYHQLDDAEWVYHGNKLYMQIRKCLDHYHGRNGLSRCGVRGIIYYSLFTSTDMQRIFHAYLDSIPEYEWMDFCYIFQCMAKVEIQDDGKVVYHEILNTQNGYIELGQKECNSVDDYINSIVKPDKTK